MEDLDLAGLSNPAELESSMLSERDNTEDGSVTGCMVGLLRMASRILLGEEIL